MLVEWKFRGELGGYDMMCQDRCINAKVSPHAVYQGVWTVNGQIKVLTKQGLRLITANPENFVIRYTGNKKQLEDYL